MANPKGNPQNFIPLNQRPKEEADAIRRMGTEATKRSFETKKETKKQLNSFADVFKTLLDAPLEGSDIDASALNEELIKKCPILVRDNEMLTTRTLLGIAAIQRAKGFDAVANGALNTIIEMTGEKVPESAHHTHLIGQANIELSPQMEAYFTKITEKEIKEEEETSG